MVVAEEAEEAAEAGAVAGKHFKYGNPFCSMNSLDRIRGLHARFVLRFLGILTSVATLLWTFPLAANTNATARTFTSPEDAVHALSIAVTSLDTNALAAIFGPEFNEIKSPDPVQWTNELAAFAAALNASNHIARVNDRRCILETGEDRCPFAIPLVRSGNSWFFHTEEGEQELINRRIGRNELRALEALRAGAQAQREYASADRDGSEVQKFAQKIVSTQGKKDGLYWSPDLDGEISPLGPAFAKAQGEGYSKQPVAQNTPRPFHGYYFKILTSQGTHAPGGKYDYIINGNMIGGFAFVAWPAQYGETGIMTFIINQQGKVYQKDLGSNTDSIVRKMTAYDPDPTWKLSPD